MSESQLLIFNSVAYGLLFLYSFFKCGKLSISSLISVLLFICSLCSLLLYENEFYYITPASTGTISRNGLIYMFVCNVLLTLAFKHCNLNNITNLSNVDIKFMDLVQKIICVAMTILVVVNLPQAVSNFTSASNVADLRESLYGTRGFGANIKIIRWIGQVFGAWNFLLLFIASTNIIILKRKRSIDTYSIVIYFLLLVQTALGSVSRSIVLYSSIELIVLLIFFRKQLSRKLKRRIAIVAFAVIPIAFTFFNFITSARAYGNGAAYTAYMNLRYSGEAQLNFSSLMYEDAKEPIYGYYQFRFFRQLVGLPYPEFNDREGGSAESTYVSQKFPHPYFIFYSIVGSYYLNWGKYTTLILFLLFYIIMRRTFRKNKTTIKYIQIYLILQFGAYITKGVFYPDMEGASANLLILLILFLYYINGKSKAIYPIRK